MNPTKYYRIENPFSGQYEFQNAGTILAVRIGDDGKWENAWLLTEQWCGVGELRGECYRPFVGDHERKWPDSADNAVDLVERAAAAAKEYFANDLGQRPSEILIAELIARILPELVR